MSDWSRYEKYFIYDEPVPFKLVCGKTLTLHPVTVRDYLYFSHFSNCLLLDKREYKANNPMEMMEIMTKTELDYLFFSSNDENNNKALLDALLRLCLKKDNIRIAFFYEKKDAKIAIFEEDDTSFENPTIIEAREFEELADTICSQNCVERIDYKISLEVKRDIERAKQLKDKLNASKFAGLEEQFIAVAVYTGWDLERVYNMTIRKFTKSLQRADLKLHYEAYLNASLSGMVTFKDESFVSRNHWLAEIKEDKFKGTMMDLDSLKNKISKGE